MTKRKLPFKAFVECQKKTIHSREVRAIGEMPDLRADLELCRTETSCSESVCVRQHILYTETSSDGGEVEDTGGRG